MRKTWRILFLSFGILLVLMASAIGWLCYTQSGLQFALQQLAHLPGMTITVTGVRGRLAGPLHMDHVRLIHERVHIDVEQLDIAFTPALLASGLIAIDAAHIGNAVVVYQPVTKVTPDKPIHFLPALLRLHVNRLTIDAGEYRHPNGYVLKLNHGQGRVAMTRHHIRVQELDARTTDFDVRGQASLDSAQVLTLNADLNAVYRVPTGVALHGTVHASGPVTGAQRQLALNSQLQAPHVMQARALLTFPDGNWLITGDATAQAIALNAWWHNPTFSLQQVVARYRFDGHGMHYSADACVPEWSPARLRMEAQTHYAKKVFTIERADVSVPKTGITSRTTGTISMTTGKPVLDLNSHWQALRWPLHASVDAALVHSPQGELHLQGSGPYEYQLNAALTRRSWPGGQLQAQGELRTAPRSSINFKRYVLNTLQGEASGSGSVELSRPYAFDLSTRATRIDPAHFFATWPGAINLVAQAQGRLLATRSEPQWFDIRVEQLSGSLRGQPITGRGRLQYHALNKQGDKQRDWQADQVQLKWGRNEVQATGRMSDVAGANQRLQVRVNAPALHELQLGWSGDLQGQAQFSINKQSLSLQADAHSANLSVAGWRAEGLNLTTSLNGDETQPSSLNAHMDRLGNEVVGLSQVQLSGAGTLAEHELTLEALPIAEILPDDVRLQVALQGGLRDAQWQGTLNKLTLLDASQTVLMQLEQAVPMQLAADQLRIDQFCVRSDDGRGCLHAQINRVQDASWIGTVQGELASLPISVRSRSLAPDARLVGRLYGAVQLTATAQTPWTGSAQAQLADASIKYQVNGRKRSLAVGQLTWGAQVDRSQLTSEAELRIGEQTVSTMTLALGRSQQPVKQWPVTGVLSLSSSDAQLIPVFFADVDRAHGTLASVLQLSGTLAQPQLAGDLKLLEGELDFYQVNLALRQLNLAANIASDARGQHVNFNARSATGVKGDQGTLQTAGEFIWRDQALSGEFTLKGERLLVADLPEYRVLATPDLTFKINARQVDVSGELLIPEARLEPKDITGAVQTSRDARLINDVILPDQDQWQVQSRVRVRMGDAVQFDGLGLQGRLTGAVNTTFSNNHPAQGDGELSITDGRYEAYGRKLDIKRGRLIYSDTTLSDPGLDIQAERNINDPTLGDITVGVFVRGVLHAPRLQFYSEPTMSQTQIVSYLLVGKPLDGLQGQEASTVRSASNTLALQGGGYLASQLGRRVGLEEVGVETNSDNQSSLVLGKFLSPRLFVSYGISLTEAINTFKLRYTLSKNWQVKSEVGNAKSADLEFKIEK